MSDKAKTPDVAPMPLRIASWVMAAYFGIDFFRSVGFFPNDDGLLKHAVTGSLFLLFLFLPFFRKIKLGELIELET
jgi:hypothetical protein